MSGGEFVEVGAQMRPAPDVAADACGVWGVPAIGFEFVEVSEDVVAAVDFREELGVFNGEVGGDDGEFDVAGHDLGGFAVGLGDELGGFEEGDLAGDLGGECGGVEE